MNIQSRTVSQPVSQSQTQSCSYSWLVSSYVPGRWGCEEGGVLRLWWSGAGWDGVRDPARWRGVLSPPVLSVRPVSRRHTCEHCFHDRPTRVHHKRSVLPHKLLPPNTLAGVLRVPREDAPQRLRRYRVRRDPLLEPEVLSLPSERRHPQVLRL